MFGATSRAMALAVALASMLLPVYVSLASPDGPPTTPTPQVVEPSRRVELAVFRASGSVGSAAGVPVPIGGVVLAVDDGTAEGSVGLDTGGQFP